MSINLKKDPEPIAHSRMKIKHGSICFWFFCLMGFDVSVVSLDSNLGEKATIPTI